MGIVIGKKVEKLNGRTRHDGGIESYDVVVKEEENSTISVLTLNDVDDGEI